MDKLKIILADDHPMIREGFKSLLRSTDWIEVVGEAENGQELISLVESMRPDVVLLDITMPRLNGLDALAKLAAKHEDIRFIILSMHEEREYIRKAVTAGAHGYLLKNVEKAELERAIRAVHDGGKYFSPAISAILAENISNPDPAPVEITPREKEVLELVAEGLSTKQIADKLGISIRTVETHRINMLKKLKAGNTAELIRKSFEMGLFGGKGPEN